MAGKYKCWEIERSEDRKNCMFKFHDKKETFEKLEACSEESDALNKEYKQIKEEIKGETDSAIRTEKSNKSLSLQQKLNKKQQEQARLAEMYAILVRNAGKQIQMERMKDTCTRKESIQLAILENHLEDVIIPTDITNLNRDIRSMESYGIYLNSAAYDEMAEDMKEVYYGLEPIEREFVDNNVPKQRVVDFVKMMNRQIHLDKEKFLDKPEGAGYYDIPVSVFRDWFENSAFKLFGIKAMKEALAIHGYSKVNHRRNDCTVAGKGKVIRLYIKEMDKEGEHNEDGK